MKVVEVLSEVLPFIESIQVFFYILLYIGILFIIDAENALSLVDALFNDERKQNVHKTSNKSTQGIANQGRI